MSVKKVIVVLLACIFAFSSFACQMTASETVASKVPITTGTTATSATSAKPTAAPVAKEPYYVALYAPLTGNNAQYGKTYVVSMNIFLKELNSTGGINGHELKIDIFDDKGDPKEALNIANKIVSDPKYIGVFGSQTSSCTLAACPLFQEVGLPMITPQASHVDITLTGEYIWRMSCLATFEGGYIGDMMLRAGYKDLAIIYPNDDYGKNITDYTRKMLAKAGANLVAVETYNPGETKDFTSILSKIKNAKAEAIYIVPGYSDAAMILTQMKQLDCKFQPFGSSMLYKKEFIDVAGVAAEGLLISNFFLPDSDEPTYTSFKNKYEKETGSMVDVYATNSYDTVKLFSEAVSKVGTDGKAIIDYLAKVKNWQGSSGLINFDGYRNPIRVMFDFQVQKGKFIHVDVSKLGLKGK